MSSLQQIFATELNGSVIQLKPWGYLDRDGQVTGRHPKLLKALETKTGIKFNFKLVPLKRVVHLLAESKTDFSMLFLREKYEHNVDLVNNIENSSLYLVLSKDKTHFPVSNLTKVGVIAGEEKLARKIFYQKQLINIEIYNPDHYDKLFNALSLNRIDAAFYVGAALDKYLDQTQQPRELFGRTELLQERTAYFFLTLNSPRYSKTLSDKIRHAIEELKKDGTLARIMATN